MPFVLPSVSSRWRLFALSGAVTLLSDATAARAQVGYLPDRSPYEDVQTPQSISLLAGWLAVRRDPANVAPDPSSIFAVRYALPVGGPASLYVRYALASSKRNLFNPGNPRTTRLLGTPGVTTHLLETGLDLSLTGQKTFHRFMPSLLGGIGVASDFAKADTGSYRFGTKFSFSYGLAVKYVLRSGYALSVEASNNLWQYQYPDRYFVKAADTSSVLTDTRNRSAWRGNWALSAGVSLPIFR